MLGQHCVPHSDRGECGLVNAGFNSPICGTSQLQNMVTGIATKAIHWFGLTNKRPRIRVVLTIVGIQQGVNFRAARHN